MVRGPVRWPRPPVGPARPGACRPPIQPREGLATLVLHVEPDEARSESYSGAAPCRGIPAALPVIVARQALDRWCWAAIGAAIAGYYRGSAPTQEAVASALLGFDCSSWAADGALGARCDVPAMLDEVLSALDCFSHWSPGRPTLDRLAAEIGAGRPLAVAIDWRGGGGHYAVVLGCHPERGEIDVADPLHGPSVQRYASFPRDYRGGGYWRGTYWTAAPRGWPGQGVMV